LVKTRLSNEIYSILYENAPDVIFVYDQTGNFIDGNMETEKLTGYNKNELIGKNFLNIDLLVPEDIPRAAENLKHSLRGEKTGPTEYMINRKDGVTAHIEVRTYPFIHESQNLVMGVARDITTQKKAENDLKKSEEKYRSFMEASRDGVTVNIQGKIVYVNPRFLEMSGYTWQELSDMSILEVTAPEYIELVKNRTRRRQAGEYVPAQYELELLIKDGTRLHVEFNAALIEYEGKPASLTFIRDISRRKQIERNLEKTQYGYQTLIEQASDAIGVTSDTEFLYANDALAHLLGYEQANEVIGLSPQQFIHPDYRTQTATYTQARRRGEFAPSRYQAKIINRNGKHIDIDIQVTLIEWQGTVASLGVSRDITQQKLFETRREGVYQLAAQLGQSNNIEEIADNTLNIIKQVLDYEYVSFQILEDEHLIPIGTRGIAPSDHRLHINDRSLVTKVAREKTTLNIPDVRESSDYYPGTSTDTLSELDVPLISGDIVHGVINVESRRMNTFGREDEVILELLAQHVASAIERVKRVAETLAYERELFEGKVRLEQEKELNQLKTRFMSTATHELRTPLSSILGYTEIIQAERAKLTEQHFQYFDVIRRNVHRLTVLTNDLLDQQKLEEGKMAVNFEQVILKELIQDVMNEFRPILAEKHQTIQVNCIDASMNIDRLRTMQVLVNLLSNASKFSPKGGQIYLNVSEGSHNVWFSVSDTGVGISPKDIPKLFTPFPDIMMESNVGSTGLGLAISKGIVDIHGGEIWAESEGKGKGTTVTFTLPLKNEE